MEKDNRASSSSNDGAKREEEEKKKDFGDNHPQEQTTNPLWSTRPGAIPTPRVVPPPPGTSEGGNPGSIYQHFFIDLKNCRCAPGQHKDFSTCQLNAEPLAHLLTRVLYRCLNCNSSLHSIFGCPDPLKAAVITWHPTNNPSRVGAVEFATDIQIGRYNIDGGQWQSLTRHQQGQVTDKSDDEGEPVAKRKKKSKKPKQSETLLTNTNTLKAAQTSAVPPPTQPQPDSTTNTLGSRRSKGVPIVVGPPGFVPHSVNVVAPLPDGPDLRVLSRLPPPPNFDGSVVPYNLLCNSSLANEIAREGKIFANDQAVGYTRTAVNHIPAHLDQAYWTISANPPPNPFYLPIPTSKEHKDAGHPGPYDILRRPGIRPLDAVSVNRENWNDNWSSNFTFSSSRQFQRPVPGQSQGQPQGQPQGQVQAPLRVQAPGAIASVGQSIPTQLRPLAPAVPRGHTHAAFGQFHNQLNQGPAEGFAASVALTPASEQIFAYPYNTANPIQSLAVPGQAQGQPASKKRGRPRKHPPSPPSTEVPSQTRQTPYEAREIRLAGERAGYPVPESSLFQIVYARSVGGRVEDSVYTLVQAPGEGRGGSYRDEDPFAHLHESTHIRPTTGTTYTPSISPSPYSYTYPQPKALRDSVSEGALDSRRGSVAESSSGESFLQAESQRFGSALLTNSTPASSRGLTPDENSHRSGSAFTALNIIPDDHPDDEIDNTKELQIEEALKLYQAALKLHSQGPEHYSEAADAYTKLFQSEIFKYPESETEFLRLDKHPEIEFTEASYTLGLDIAAAGAEAAPSTLPQILYLSYKNHGQFILDCVKGRLRHEPLPDHALDYQAKAAIDNFALALASDESDTELWRRAARIGSMLGSRRIARYCLEAAVEVDDDPTVAEVDPMSLEEGFSGEQLKQQLEVLGDETALSHPVIAPYLKKKMPQFLARAIDPYPFLPDASESLQIVRTRVEDHDSNQSSVPLVINLEYRSWLGLGEKLCDIYLSPMGLAATRILLNLPPEPKQIAQNEPVQQPDAVVSVEAVPVEDHIMKDVGTTESPAAESGEAGLDTPVTSKSDDALVEVVTTTTTVPLSSPSRRQSSVTLPTRKRSQSAAGIRETPEDDGGTQKRSKRIRNRDNTEGIAVDPATLFAEQLKPFSEADDGLFTFVAAQLAKLGVDGLGTLPDLHKALQHEDKTDRDELVTNTAVRDLRDILRTWDDPKASTFVNGNAADILGSSVSSANAGLAAFLDQSKVGPQRLTNIPWFADADGLSDLAIKVNSEWMPLHDVVWEWLCTVLPTYQGTLWPETMKVMVVRIITYTDSEIFSRLQMEIDQARGDLEQLGRWENFVETLFELHIDIYSRITNPTSAVPYETRLLTKDRLDRWADFAADVIRARNGDHNDELSSRYLWASVFYATMADNVSREHKVLCWSDLQSLLRESGQSTIDLQNNAVMAEISVEAAEREVSRLTTMDFFFNLFQTDRSDPIAIIETLEPVLDPDSARESLVPDAEDTSAAADSTDGTPAALRDMWKFLKSGSTSLRLFLWQRLREAYFSIGYNTKVFSCHLKSIEIIVDDLRTSDYVDSADEPRQHKLLQWLKALDDLLVKSLTIALNDAATCFEIIDERHIKSTCAALAQLTRVLHTAALFDDEIRVGLTQLPQNAAYAPHGSFNSFINKLREMQVRTWALQYTMVKEAMSQNIELFTTPDKDLADYLARVHFSLGLRKCCKASNKIFLKMMKVEMIRLKHIENWEDYLGQVLYDLYGVRLGVGTYLLEEHGCPTEQLDRRTVMNIADQVIVIANRMPMKDLLKHELRGTLERMQTAVGPAKSSPQMQHNLRNYTEYLKTSIRPSDLYKAWKGQVMVDSLPVVTPESPLADKNWYFLMGMINLTKFRSQKRLGPGAQTDDLRVAATFLRLQLQFSGDFWETWYRLAQCFDHELEEEVLWSADKINNHRPDLVRLQRSSIHCYVMALSTAFRAADDSFETAEKLSEMYYDFGMRVYTASREPFTMEAFWVDEFEKHMSGAEGMYKKPLHEELTRYRAWNYAASLFKESLRDRPNQWMAYFMIGKCLWKMFCKADAEWDPKVKATRPSMDAVLNAFTSAIKKAPKHNSNSRSEPLLEPHYKLVSIVHKLVQMQEIQPQAAADLLQKQPFAPNKGEDVVIQNFEEWESYILSNLRHLRAADKQHWNHRMVARVAGILFDEANPNFAHATAARNELRESIFTKTMHIQVWKSEAERAGRHCVYMERYVLLMVKLLWLTNDKTSMEALVKRVRKKNNDFHKFDRVWAECCTTYLRLIRRQADITASMDDVFKTCTHEEFETLCGRLDNWVKDPRMSHPALDALKEAGDLKKLNNNFMKSTPIDDLINDAWATLYIQIAKALPDPDSNSLANSQIDGAGETSTVAAMRSMGPMSLNNLVMDMNGTQIPVPVTFAGSEPSRPRKLGISRREVLRRAEQALSRMPDVPRAIAPSTSYANPRNRLSEPSPSLILGSNDGPKQRRSGSAATSTPHAETPAGQEANTDEMETETAAEQEEGEEAELAQQLAQDQQTRDATEAEAEVENESVRGSVHDSADDESDLSDLPDMDDVDASAIFPNLMGNSHDEEEDEDGDEEEEEEEEDEEEEEEVGESGAEEEGASAQE